MPIISTALRVYLFVVLVYVVLSWVPRPPEPLMPLVRGSRALVDPVLQPLRSRIQPVRLGGIALDLSVIILFVVVQVLIAVFAGMGL